MIEPKPSSVGRRVLYDTKIPGVTKAKGIITALDEKAPKRWAWVKFDGNETSHSVGVTHLYWETKRK